MFKIRYSALTFALMSFNSLPLVHIVHYFVHYFIHFLRQLTQTVRAVIKWNPGNSEILISSIQSVAANACTSPNRAELKCTGCKDCAHRLCKHVHARSVASFTTLPSRLLLHVQVHVVTSESLHV